MALTFVAKSWEKNTFLQHKASKLASVPVYELTSEHRPLAFSKFHLCWHQTSEGFRVNDGEDQNVEGNVAFPFSFD